MPDQPPTPTPPNAVPQPVPSDNDSASQSRNADVHQLLERYWQSNMRIMAALIFIWAGVSLGCSALLAEFLNQFKFLGVPLGFWFAQQGSIVVFLVLILVYALLLNHLDRKHHQDLERLGANANSQANSHGKN